MHGRWFSSGFFALGCLLFGAPALAQPAPAAPPEPNRTASEDGTVTESVFYGQTVALLYGIGYAGMGAGYFLIRPRDPEDRLPVGARLAGAILLPSGAITALFGPMLTHMDHGSFDKGLLSAGGQVAAVLVGAAAGYGVAKIAGSDDTGTAMLVGGAGAHISWALFDTFYLAREERVLERTTPAPSYSLVLDPGGFRARVGFQF